MTREPRGRVRRASGESGPSPLMTAIMIAAKRCDEAAWRRLMTGIIIDGQRSDEAAWRDSMTIIIIAA